MFFTSTAYAQTPGAAPSGHQAPSVFEQFLPLVLIVVVLYLFVIRPQGKKHKAHQEFLAAIKRGDSVFTTSGILGRVEGITEKFVTLEVADGVRLKILKNYIAGAAEEKHQ